MPSVLPISGPQNYQNNGSGGNPGTTGDTGTGTAGVPYLGQKFGVVSQVSAADYFVDAQNNLTIAEPTGQIVKIAPTGEQTTLSPSAISNLVSASFSSDGKKVLALFGNPLAPQASIFDTIWVSATQVLLKDKPSASTQGALWSFNPKAKALTAIAENAPGLESNWSGAANEGLIFESSGGLGGGMRLVDSNGTSLRNFSLATLPTKCLFDQKITPIMATSTAPTATSTKSTSTKAKIAPAAPTSTVSWVLDCAVPRDAQTLESFALPDAYNKKELVTSDDFYQVDLLTGAVSTIFADATQSVDATNLKIFNNTIFFVNRLNDKVYAISLK